MSDLPHNWRQQLHTAVAIGRRNGGLACCGTAGMEHLPFCQSGIPSNTMTIHAFLGRPEPVNERSVVPLVIYKEDGERVVIGSATLLEDGTAQMEVDDKKFLEEHFRVSEPLSVSLALQEFSIAAEMDEPPVIKWTLKDDCREL